MASRLPIRMARSPRTTSGRPPSSTGPFCTPAKDEIEFWRSVSCRVDTDDPSITSLLRKPPPAYRVRAVSTEPGPVAWPVMELVVSELMTTQVLRAITPQTLINIRPVVARQGVLRHDPLSRSMDQPTPGLAYPQSQLSALARAACPVIARFRGKKSGTFTPLTTAECARSRLRNDEQRLIGSLPPTPCEPFRVRRTALPEVTHGKATTHIDYPPADEEDRPSFLVMLTAHFRSDGTFIEDRVLVRTQGGRGRTTSDPRRVLHDSSPRQLVSDSALIPFP